MSLYRRRKFKLHTCIYRKVREDTMLFITAILRVLCFERKAIIVTFVYIFGHTFMIL